jgi:hypothetical protein
MALTSVRAKRIRNGTSRENISGDVGDGTITKDIDR